MNVQGKYGSFSEDRIHNWIVKISVTSLLIRIV